MEGLRFLLRRIRPPERMMFLGEVTPSGRKPSGSNADLPVGCSADVLVRAQARSEENFLVVTVLEKTFFEADFKPENSRNRSYPPPPYSDFTYFSTIKVK